MQNQATINNKPKGLSKGWLFVILTCTAELVWVYGFLTASLPWHFMLIAALIVLDFYFLFKACELIPTGTVYALFAASGTAGTALMDLFLFNGSFNFAKTFFMSLLLIGVIMLKLADGKSHTKS